MTPVRTVAAIALAGIAVAAALLADDVRAWRQALDSGDAVYAVAPARASWAPPTRLGGVAKTILGVSNEVALRHALQRYRVSIATPDRLDTAVEAQTSIADAEDALTRVAHSTEAPTASQAFTLLGVLAFGRPASGSGPSQAETAVSDFTNAIELDPANSDAKFDLELLLRLMQAHGSRVGAGQSAPVARNGRHGAGGGVPGSGY